MCYRAKHGHVDLVQPLLLRCHGRPCFRRLLRLPRIRRETLGDPVAQRRHGHFWFLRKLPYSPKDWPVLHIVPVVALSTTMPANGDSQIPNWLFRLLVAIPGAAEDHWRFLNYCSEQLENRMKMQGKMADPDISHTLIEHYVSSPSEPKVLGQPNFCMMTLRSHSCFPDGACLMLI